MAAAGFQLKKWLTLQRHRVCHGLIGHIPRRRLETFAFAMSKIQHLLSPTCRADGNIRAEIGRNVIGLPEKQAGRAKFAAQLETLVDQRIYFGRYIRNGESWTDLDAIAESLADQVKALKRNEPSRPVFISPFHYVSQYANIYVVERIAALLGLTSLSVVSGVPRDQYGDDHSLIPGISVLYTYGDANRVGLGVRLARRLKRDGVAVLFADIPPFSMHSYPMETIGVSLLGRNARVHRGIFRIGGQFNALMLPFYLRFEKGCFSARTFDLVELASPTAPQQLADCIQIALSENYQQWTCAGHPSMYAFAPAR
ncbi:hypothetical protein QCE49_23605 [Caballeronia sp. LZ008]|uniref:hypothetical protein n=1 Tax=unclassified Caballeronia TaxID=2646786 RepID=UPI0020294B74|nr:MULTISPECIES: hypothetical protein [unclassified Caballeronia]MDR5796375.1 hypothetical protein [Caballeronia sp. LZ008]